MIFSPILICLLGALSTALPAPPRNPQPTGAVSSSRELKVKSTRYTSPMSFLSEDGSPMQVYPDLGFSGVLNGQIIWLFGDTSVRNAKGEVWLNAVDSTAIGDVNNPMQVKENNVSPGSGFINSLVPLTSEEEAEGGYNHWGFGGTNIVEVSPNNGLVYYLKLYREASSHDYTVYGAGIATVTLDSTLKPNVQRAGSTIWSNVEPAWGDTGVLLDSTKNTLYVYGHGPRTSDNQLSDRVFVARVPADQATDVQAYEYYSAATRSWSKQRMTSTGAYGTKVLSNDDAISSWLQVGQAPPFWSDYFQKWMWIYGDQTGESDVYVRMAEQPEGPWTDHGKVAETNSSGKTGKLKYAVNGHPEYDASGKTVLTTWSEDGQILGVVIEWE